jgi:uncharacterized lipoprotein YajG
MRTLAVLTLAAAAILIGGCSFKSTNIEFSEPVSIYMGDKVYAKAFLEGVKDERADKSVLGAIRNKKGELLSTITTSQDMAKWFGAAFEKEMRAAGFVPVSKPEDADLSYLFIIKNLSADYTQGELFGKNLRLQLLLEARISNKYGVVTKNYKYDEQKWSEPLFKSEAIKKELEPFMRQSIADTVKSLASGINVK